MGSIFEKRKFHGTGIVIGNLSDTNFLNVCILQRHALLKEPKLLKKATDAVEKIQKILTTVNEKSPSIDVSILKELFLVISIFGSDGDEKFKYFSTYANTKHAENICKIVFAEENSEQLNIIQTFSKKYEGYDALSLTTFENIDFIIQKLITEQIEYVNILEERDFSMWTTGNLFPECFHESLFDEQILPFKFDINKKSVVIELPINTIELCKKTPDCSYRSKVERFCYDMVRTFEAMIKRKYWKKTFDINIDDEDKYTPILQKLMDQYRQKSKKRFKQPMDYLYPFCGIKIWDYMNREAMKEEEAKKAFDDWFNEFITICIYDDFYDDCYDLEVFEKKFEGDNFEKYFNLEDYKKWVNEFNKNKAGSNNKLWEISNITEKEDGFDKWVKEVGFKKWVKENDPRLKYELDPDILDTNIAKIREKIENKKLV